MTGDDPLRPLDESGIRRLLDNHDRFRAFLARRLPSRAVADEILQQSLLKALEKRDTVTDEESLVPWFFRLLRNALVDYYRSHGAELRKHESFFRELEARQTPAADELRGEICACLERLLPTLRPAYGDLIRRVDLEGQAPEQAAAQLGLTLNNLWVRLHRARKALRTSLERSCGSCTEHACLDCSCKVSPPVPS